MAQTAIHVGERVFRTYPFSDPDPIPATGERRYPYFRYDGSTDAAEDRAWRTVVLENDRLAVTILPEVGGKVWGAYDKIAQRDFLYANHVMKFRDIALRGPWLSGGIEFNFGILGHSPSTSTPVDWTTRANPDGSASCFVASDEYITRTRWQVEIRLAPEADFFETRVTWFNSSGVCAPYYHWMNAAYSLRHAPEFLFPGEVAVGHEGETVVREWPVDEKGRDLSVYANNAHGGPKSYHMVGGNNGFYGIWWQDLGYGSCHRSVPYEKYGRKIWLWALSREGGIWEDLLTDEDGQYAELQSGRGYIQPRWRNVETPFKHPAFVPGATETFAERWAPLRNRADAAADLAAKGPELRPVDPPPAFDFANAHALALLGLQDLRDRDDDDAAAHFAAALAKDPCESEALRGLAELAYRRGDYGRVHDYARRALAVDLYDAEANYLDGAAYFAAGDLVSARDRLGIAAFPGAYRAAARTLIARTFLREGDFAAACAAADEALRSEGLSCDALLVKAIALRGKPERERFLDESLERLPLFPGFVYERDGAMGLASLVRNELPHETYLELGSWYEESGIVEDAKALFRLARPNPEAEIRLAALEERAPVVAETVAGCFPFRRESRPALERAAARPAATWKEKYLLAVLKNFFRETADASALLDACGEAPDEATFYAYRARTRTGAARIADLMRARELGDSWRVGRDLVLAYEEAGDFERMRAMAEDYLAREPGRNPLQIAYARALLKLERYAEAMDYLKGVKILPSEHRDSATGIWQACQKALGMAVTWPENLGQGEPFHDGEWRQRA